MLASSTGLSVGPIGVVVMVSMVVMVVGPAVVPIVDASVSGTGVGVGEGAMGAIVTIVTVGLCPIARDTMLTSASHCNAILLNVEISASMKLGTSNIQRSYTDTNFCKTLHTVRPSTSHYFLVVP